MSSKNCFYHIAEVNYVIIQPSFAGHAVVTEAKLDVSGRKIWALVTGIEAISKEFDAGRRLKEVNRLATGIDKGVIAKELKIHDLAYLVRLL